MPLDCSVLDLKSRFEIYGTISCIRIDQGGVGYITYRIQEYVDAAIAAALAPSFGITISSKRQGSLKIFAVFADAISSFFRWDESTLGEACANFPSCLRRASILGSLYGWLITSTTHVSMLWSSMSRLILFFSELVEIPNSRRNIDGGVHDQPRRPQDLTTSLHTIYCFLIGSLLALIAIKYQGSSTNPFIEHFILMMFFLIAISVYGVALTITLGRSNHDHSTNKLMVGVSHVCGVFACELLLLVLVSPIQSLLINLYVPTLMVMLALCKKYDLLYAQGTEEQASQMTDVEAPTISAA